jgi:LysM repeat protein
MLRKILFSFLAITILSTTLYSQNVQVEVSRNKVRVDGKSYYVHIVKKGETLYSISKAYGVSQSDIAVNNPDIYAGLKVGQALKIPVRVKKIDSDENFIYHIVKRKETLFGISRMYNVTIDEILNLNPEAKDGLKTSQTLRIPKKHISAIQNQAAVDTIDFIMHEVQPREGLFAISRQYGVSPKEIEFYNSDLVKGGLKLGTVLRIPIKKSVVEQQDTVKQDTLTQMLSQKGVCQDTFDYDGRMFNVALLLPFTQQKKESADGENEGLEEETPKAEIKKISQISEVSLEFYEGFLLALDTLKRLGVSVSLNAYDTKRSAVHVNEILSDESFRKNELIIGPFLYEEIKPVAKYATDEKVNFISPIYSKIARLDKSQNVISVNQSFYDQLRVFAANFEPDTSKNYVVVLDSSSLIYPGMSEFDSLLMAKANEYGVTIQKFFHKTSSLNSFDLQSSLLKVLNKDSVNVVIVPSEDEPFVTDILGSLYAVKSYYGLTTEVYGPSRWRRLKNVPSDYLFALNTCIFSPFYVDYSRADVKNFIAKYRETYRDEPSQFSYLGFDVGYYFISALKEFGPDFSNCLSTFPMQLLQSEFKFNLVDKGYMLNDGLYFIRYNPDFTLSYSILGTK